MQRHAAPAFWILWLVRDYFFQPEISAEPHVLYGLAFLVFALVMTLVIQGRKELEAGVAERTVGASDWLWEIGPDYKYTLLTDNAFGSDPAHRISTASWDHALDLETEPEK